MSFTSRITPSQKAFFDLCRFDFLKNSNPSFETKEIQRKIVKSLIQNHTLNDEKVVCVIDSQWFNKWKKYVEFDQHVDILFQKIPELKEEENEGENNSNEIHGEGSPGKINNLRLIKNPNEFLDWIEKNDGQLTEEQENNLYCPVSILELKNDLKVNVDFEIVPSKAWEFLMKVYGGFHKGYGPSIPRYRPHILSELIVLNYEGNMEKNVSFLYPYMIPCSISTKDNIGSDFIFTVLRFSRTLSFNDVGSIISWFHGVSEEYTKWILWLGFLKSPWKEVEAHAFSVSLGEYCVMCGSPRQLILEVGADEEDLRIMAGRRLDGWKEKYGNLSNHLRFSCLDEYEIPSERDVGIVTTSCNYGDYMQSFANFVFQCLSKVKCFVDFFTRRNFKEIIKEHRKNQENEVIKDFGVSFGEAMIMMWNSENEKLFLKGLKHCMEIAGSFFKSKPDCHLDVFVRFLELLISSPFVENGLIEENFFFQIQTSEDNSSRENRMYIPVDYFKDREEGKSIEKSFFLEEMIQKFSVSNKIITLPKILVIGSDDNIGEIGRIRDRIITPTELEIESIVGSDDGSKPQMFSHYELFGVIYTEGASRDVRRRGVQFGWGNYYRNENFCRVRVPRYTYHEDNDRNNNFRYQWYKCVGSRMKKMENLKCFDCFETIDPVKPVIWFYEGIRNKNWDDPELVSARMMYLVDQASLGENSEVLTDNLKLSFQGYQNDLYISFVFLYIG